jgi:uncharacterized protein YggE
MRSFALPLIAALSFVTALVTTIAVLGALPGPARTAVAAADDLRSTVTVVGDGRVLVQPDIATVTFGVEATGQTMAAAQADASTRMQAVIDALVGLGVPREEIKTNRLSASPVYDQRNPSTIQGYRANNSVQVKLRQIDQVGTIVDAITAAGANRVEGISFGVDQIAAPKGQARALAMQNARARADELATLAGLRVTAVKAISESDPGSPPVRPQPMAFESPAAAAAAPPVEPGTQEIRSQVTVTYVIE